MVHTQAGDRRSPLQPLAGLDKSGSGTQGAVKRRLEMGYREARVKWNGFEGTVSINNPVLRYPGNPILTSHEVNKVWAHEARLHCYTVHNAGMAKVVGSDGQEQTIMLFRSHIADGRSVIGKAVSENGINAWRVDPQPFLLPATEKDIFAEGVDIKSMIEWEAGGVEDIRVNPVGNGSYILTYSAYQNQLPDRVKVMMAVTQDFHKVIRYGPMFQADMRNVVIFPEPDGNGRWRALLRPNDKEQEATVPHLGSDKNLFPGNTTFANGLTHSGLVLVIGSSVNASVSGIYSIFHCIYYFCSFSSLEYPQSQPGHLNPIIQYGSIV
jgi:hypothetical protein